MAVKAYPVGPGISEAAEVAFHDCASPADLVRAWGDRDVLVGITEEGFTILLNCKAITAFVIAKEIAE